MIIYCHSPSFFTKGQIREVKGNMVGAIILSSFLSLMVILISIVPPGMQYSVYFIILIGRGSADSFHLVFFCCCYYNPHSMGQGTNVGILSTLCLNVFIQTIYSGIEEITTCYVK